MKEYNKLVRDYIPQIIEENGNKSSFHILSKEEYMEELDKKLNEEVKEYQQDKSLDEMADILEVLLAICKVRGYSEKDLEDKRREKAGERGVFQNKIFLEYVEDDDLK